MVYMLSPVLYDKTVDVVKKCVVHADRIQEIYY